MTSAALLIAIGTSFTQINKAMSTRNQYKTFRLHGNRPRTIFGDQLTGLSVSGICRGSSGTSNDGACQESKSQATRKGRRRFRADDNVFRFHLSTTAYAPDGSSATDRYNSCRRNHWRSMKQDTIGRRQSSNTWWNPSHGSARRYSHCSRTEKMNSTQNRHRNNDDEAKGKQKHEKRDRDRRNGSA